jgi:sterol desaturase/sphingolipid hydroxylase (fatty acid hydroxylase superfamily)
MAAAVMAAVESPLTMRVARRVEERGLGLVPHLVKSPAAQFICSIALLDYGLYLWHVLTHRVPALWRFHLVHHVDLDLDASTALRFHFGEMLLSVPWRVAQARVTGASPLAVSAWQMFLFASVLFHHSNVRIPLRAERILRFIVVTPRLHGIHHRPELSCTDSNWSSGLALWDFLHRTYCWREDENEAIGVPGYERPGQVTLPKCISMPFRDVSPGFQRDSSITRAAFSLLPFAERASDPG